MPQKIIIPKESIEAVLATGCTIKEAAKKLKCNLHTLRKKMGIYGLKTSNTRSYGICKNCGKKLCGRQRFFCSKECKSSYFWKNNKNYKSNVDNNISYQSDRGRRKKYALLKERGMCCEMCGYDKNLAALCFHHIDEHTKKYGLDSRMFASKSIESLREEISKCKILCHNCHMELHHPDWDKERMEAIYDK